MTKGANYYSIELFAGAGGLALGLETAGFTTRALVEIDHHSCETLRANRKKYFPRAKIFERDIIELDPTEVLEKLRLKKKDVTLIAGGPPCQGFSIAKTSKGGRQIEDPRNSMFLHFAKFLREIEPTVFLMENVPGLTNMEKGKVLDYILKHFGDLGYEVNHDVLNSADYGVPQLRRRLFILGFKGDRVLQFPAPTHSPHANNLLGLPKYRTIRDAFSELTPDMPNQEMPRHTAKKVKRLAGIKPGGQWQGWHFRDTMDRPSRTITGHCRDDWVHPVEHRAGTVREMAALQTYPNDYVFKGPIMALNYVKFNFQYRQVGNSVPVLLAKAIGKSIIKQLQRVEKNEREQKRADRIEITPMVRREQAILPVA